MKQLHIAAWLLWLVSLVGCTARLDDADERDEELGVSASRLDELNGLNLNGLNLNGLNLNGLNLNGLNLNGLSVQARASIEDPGDLGELSRMVLMYTVHCALDSSQSFGFSWTDSDGMVHNELYPGHIGLAPEWASGALSTFGQQMVSACLAARTNRYGTSVVISMRSQHDPLRIHVLDEERTAYPFIEGGFWGNLFAPTPYLRACHTVANIDYSRDAQRACATGHVNAAGGIETCGMIEIVGTCEANCRKLNVPGQLYWDCTDPVHGRTNTVITTALP